MRTNGNPGAWLTAAALTVLVLGACGRPAPAGEAQANAAPDPAAQSTTPTSGTVDADASAQAGNAGAEATGDGEQMTSVAAPALTADNVSGVADTTPGRAGVKITSQNPIVAPTPTTAPPAVTEPMAAEGTGGVHVVQPGDTLSAIASTYGVPVQAIADANGMVDVDDITPGDELQIPAAN